MARTASPRQEWLLPLPASFTYSTARERGLSKRALYTLLDEGLLAQIGRGLYQRTDLDGGDPDLAAAALRAPQATICLRSALARHDLSDDIPTAHDLALPAGTRPPTLDSPIHWHRFARETFEIGRELLSLDEGLTIGIYSAERSLIDAFRLRRLEGSELGNEALKRWLATTGRQPGQLIKMAEQFPRAAGPLRRALEVLL